MAELLHLATTDHCGVGRRAIAAEIAALTRLHDDLGEEFALAAQALTDLEGKLITLGIGKSGHAAQKVAGTMRSIGVPALYLNASDSLHGDLGVVAPGDIAMLFSKSGATLELLALVPHLRTRDMLLIAVVGNASSQLASHCDLVLEAAVEREGCPLEAAPMASVMAAQAVGDALAAAAVEARGFTRPDFALLHPSGALGARLTLSVSDVMRRGRELPTVRAGGCLKDAVIEITRTGYGAVCVLDARERLAGFITDGDIRRALLHTDNLADVPMAAVMTRDPLTLRPELPLAEALQQLEARRKPFLTAPVTLADGRCVGLLRLHDTVRAHMTP